MIEYQVRVDKYSTEWYLNDQLHRVDGPAVERTSGLEAWYLNGVRHREGGPAIEHANGYKVWFQNGQRHRADGPAVESVDGHKEWYLDGKRVTQAEVMKPVKQLTVAQIEVLLGHKIKVVAG